MLNLILRTLLPPACGICQRGSKPLCPTCCQDLCRIDPHWNLKAELYLPAQINQVFAALEYETLAKKLVANIKYQGLYHYCQVAAQIMDNQYGRQLKALPIEALVPVPLTTARQRWRGYNQSFLLAYHLGKKLKLPLNNNILVRNSFQSSQTKKTKLGRSNQKNPFSARYHPYQHLCLVDDVITTGSTLLKCCQAIWAVTPDVSISAASLAIAVSATVPDTVDK